MKNPEEIAVAKENIGNENITHQYFVTQAHQRYEVLRRLLDFAPDIYGIIFTRTKQDAQDVSEKLMREGYDVSPLHGDMDQKMRTKVMDRFKKRHLQAIVATDVAARGIDVSDVTHVINYELPDDTEVYTHRSGRTARAGKTGICMSIVSAREIGKIRQIERIVKSKFEKESIPQAADIINKRLQHYFAKVENVEINQDFLGKYEETIKEKFANLSKEDLINKLVWLQLKDTIASYENAVDLNAKTREKPNVDKIGLDDDGNKRLFINLGSKDGLTTAKLIQLLTESSDLDGRLFSRITVRELSSFFNVPSDASEYITQNLSQQKFNSRRIRIEEADKKPSYRGGSGSDRGGERSSGGGYRGNNGDGGKRESYRKREGGHSHGEQTKFSRQKRGYK